ncbi:O-succinylbenzoic acid--CoA ligase [Frigoribacterium sp. PhB107]|uniref:AMP-binding protein n=1 Tax=Frigoribacterium sp. PhB107 TaxID=2485172 RepID=UPI000F9D960E|nr:AMP-binding protein [Frigoribacterium sp. PhB107]ROP78452.1 O-succinylbenzoic acid--CoA ligase [Frigoribacterium sp. PhB107]
MTRPLLPVDARRPLDVLEALREALAGGPAVAPRTDDHVPADLPATVPQPVALVVETSGSSGVPKRVMLPADAVLAGAAAADGALSGPGQWVLALPAHYVAGTNVLVRSIAAGTEPEVLAPGHFDPVAFAEAASRLEHPVRYASLVPAQLAAVLDAAEHDADVADAARSFAAVLVGGQATPASLVDRARASGVAVVRTYGSSETSGGCVYDGVPVGRTRVAVVDGQVELAGPSLALGYLGDDDRTEAAFVVRDGERWYRTGDAGSVSDDGVLTVSGRLDDVVVSGGEKVSLGLVERLIREQPGLAGAVVVRAPHERWGEVPVVVVGEGGSPAPHLLHATPRLPELPELRAVVSAALGRAAAPDRLVLLPELPLLASGKPDRRALEALVAGEDPARN